MYNGQTKRDKRTNNDLQNNTRKQNCRKMTPTKKQGDEFRCFGKISSSCITSGTRRISLDTNPVISIE